MEPWSRSGNGSFGANLLHDRAEGVARLFASPTRAGSRGHLGGPPRTWECDGAFAMAECRVSQIVTIDDHAVVFGHVTHVECQPGASLLYGRRALTRLLAQEARHDPDRITADGTPGGSTAMADMLGFIAALYGTGAAGGGQSATLSTFLVPV